MAKTDVQAEPIKVLKYELNPNNAQIAEMKRHARMARYSWNWALGKIDNWNKLPKDTRGRKPGVYSLQKEWTVWISSDRGKERLAEIGILGTSRKVIEGSFRDLNKSISAFFSNLKKPKGKRRKVGYPKPRKVIPSQESFHLYGTTLRAVGRSVTLPVLGTIRTKETTHVGCANISSATVKRDIDRWYVSLRYKDKSANPGIRPGPAIAVHLGLKFPFTIMRSDKETPEMDLNKFDGSVAIHGNTYRIDHPSPLEHSLKKLRRVDRELARRRLGRPMKPDGKPVKPASNNYKKSRVKRSIVHRRVRLIRADFLNKLSTYLAKNFRTIIIEDWRIDNLLKQKKYSRAIADKGWRIFWNMLEYKCPKFGSDLLVMDTGFPSSKKCSSCGYVKKEFPLSARTFVCDECGMRLERETNAATNLMQDGLGIAPR